MMIDYLIVGNGVAGKKAAETIREVDNDGSITIVSEENHLFYYRPQLPRFVANKIKERTLYAKSADFYSGKNIDLKLGAIVTNISTLKNQVTLDNGDIIEYKKLLLAPGGRLVQKNYPGSEKTDDVIGLKTIDDAIFVKEKITNAKHAIVVGDSFLSIFLVEALKESGLSVTYIIRDDRLFPDFIDIDASKIIEAKLQQKGIDLLKGTDIKEIDVRKGAIYGVHTTNDKFIECQLVGVAEGLKPDINFLEESGIASGNGIFVDNQMKTNVPNVFAAGDAAMQLNSGHTDTPQINIRWLKAWKQGIVAGQNMAGGKSTFNDIECFASTQIYKIDMVSIGVSNPVNGKYKIMRGDYPHPEIDVYKKLVLEDDVVVGALLVGNVQEASAIMKAILEGRKIGEIDKSLLKQMFDLNYRISPHHGIICPVCKLQISLDPDVKEGDTINCPACGIEIKVKNS